MTAVNVGGAYVELAVKYDNTIKKVSDDIGGLDRAAATAAGRVSDHFTRGFRTVHSEATRAADGAGRAFSEGLTKGIGEAFRGVSSQMGSFGGVADRALSGLTSTAGLTALGVLGIGAAAVTVGKQLYDLGSQWDTISDQITFRTGLVGTELDKVKDSVKRVGDESSASLASIGDIAGRLSGALGITGEPLDKLTEQLATLQEKMGDQPNIRELAKVFKGFNTDASDMSGVVDQLYDTFTRTQIPVSELITSLRVAGPTARTLGFDVGQTAGLIATFNEAGIDSATAVNSLRIAMGNLSKEKPPIGVLGDFLKAEDGKDITTKISDLITEINRTGNIDLAKQAFGRSWANIFDAIRNGKLTVEDFNKALEPTGNTIKAAKDATDDWNEELKKTWNHLKSELEPTASTVFSSISVMIENNLIKPFSQLNDLVDMLGKKLPTMQVPGIGPNANLPGVNFPTGPYATPPGVNPPGTPGLPSSGSQGQGWFPGPLTPGQQQGQHRGIPTPGFQQWQVYDPSTGQWTTQEVPRSTMAPPEAPKPPEIPLAPPTSELDDSATKEKKAQLPPAPVLPYNTALPPGFLQLPQTTALFSAESGFIDARHDLEEKQARLNQLASDSVATERDIQDARNNVYQAEIQQQQAELRMYDTRQDMFDKERKRAEDENKRIEDETKKYESQFSGGSLIDFLLFLMFQPTIDQIRSKIPGGAGTGGASAATSGFGAGSLASFGLGAPSSFTGAGGAGAVGAGFRQPYGLAPGSDSGGYGGSGVQFPDWVTQLGAQFGVVPSTYPGHQTTGATGQIKSGPVVPNPEGLNRGIDWKGSPEAMQAFAEYLQSTGLAEQVIYQNPTTGSQVGYPLNADYSGNYPQHDNHVHTRFSQSPPMGANSGSAQAGPGHLANWDATAQGESSGNWSINTGNGFYGGLQFQQSSWELAGGTAFAPRADLATPEQQKTIADKLYQLQGPGAWPNTFKGYTAGGGVDTVPAMLQPGEHVFTTADVNAMGGQGGVYAFRKSLHGYAIGGEVGSDGVGGDRISWDDIMSTNLSKSDRYNLWAGLGHKGSWGFADGGAVGGDGAIIDPNLILQQLAEQGQLPGSQHLPVQGPQPISTNGQQPSKGLDVGRTGGYIPAGAGASGTSGSSLFSGAVGMGADVINWFIDQGAALASQAASAAITAGSMGAAAAAGPGAGAAATFGIQTAANLAKQGVSYGAQVLGIAGDAAVEILSPFGVPRFFNTDPKGFMPQIGALPIGITTGEKALMGGPEAGGPVQPGQLPGMQPVGPSAKKAEPGGVATAATPGIQGIIDNLSPKLPGAQQPHQGSRAAPGPGPVTPSAAAGAAQSAYRSGAYSPNIGGTQNDYSVNVQSVTVKDVGELQQSLADKQKLQMMRYAGRPS